ncbi:MAG: glycosyltransferase family 4 protein [Ruminococcaceae bacterium]|nr:glycosyltransferase family 4 protein [Oscillospiraceae bacterium]
MTHVLLISHELIPSVRLCGYEQYTRMQEQGLIEFRFSPAKELTPALAGWADVIQFVRSDSAAELACARAWRRAGKYLIYALDDDLFEIPSGFGSSEYYHRENVRSNMREIMRLCHCFLSPSAHLREKYGKDFERVCAIEEPALYIDPPSPTRQPNDKIRIGFAGSVDRAGDIDGLLHHAIALIGARYKDRVTVEFFGAKPYFADANQFRHIPYSDSYEDYQKTMRELNWDIGLAPMPETEFHRGKHYNKFIEYAACGIVGVYSDVPPYHGVVEHEVTGLMTDNYPGHLFEALERLILDPALLATMRRNVTALATGRFSLPAVTDALRAELGDTLALKTDHTPLRFTKKLRRVDLTERIRAGIRQEGFFPFVRKKSGKVFSRIFSRKTN